MTFRSRGRPDDPERLTDLFLPRVPIYVRPRTVIATTVAASAGAVGIFYGAAVLVGRATWRALNTSEKYGHRPKENQ